VFEGVKCAYVSMHVFMFVCGGEYLSVCVSESVCECLSVCMLVRVGMCVSISVCMCM